MSEARKKTGCCSCMIANQVIKEGKLTFEKPEKIKDLEELSYQYTYAEGSNYADNIQNIYMKKPTGADVSLTFSDLPIEIEAKIMGKRYSRGGTSTNVNNKAKPVAILFRETFSDGSFQNKVFYNVKLSKDENSGKTEGENIDFTAVSLKGKAIPFTNDKVEGEIDFIMDSGDPKVDIEKLNKFFEEVQYFEEGVIEVLYSGYTSGVVTEISIKGATFDKGNKKFNNIPETVTEFTFKLDSNPKKATKSKEKWTIA